MENALATVDVNKVSVRKAEIMDIDNVARLFDLYRIFYNQESNLEAAENFITQRIQRRDSIILIAEMGKELLGFAQIYHSFSSVSMQPLYILNDLFVMEDYRNMKVGENLLVAIQNLASRTGQKEVILETAIDNPAQKLYERLEWHKNVEHLHYYWKVN